MTMKNLCVGLSIVLISGAVNVMGQTTVNIPDTYDPGISNAFDVADGTLVSTNGVLVVFEGELSLDTNITADVDSNNGKVLASTQLYVQMKLFDTLPSVESFTNSQAAALAVFDSGSTNNGTLYGLTTVGGVSSWVQLTNNVTSSPMAVTAGATNLVTVIIRYPDGGSYTDHEYTVSLSTPADPDQITSQVLTSAVTTESGITGLSVEGEGAMASTSSTAGDPAPLSSRVDFSVYFNNGKFVVDIYTVDENGSGQLEVYAWIDGQWKLIGTADAVGSGNNHYRLNVSDLTVGESYRFKVVDEEGRVHLSDGEIEVKSIVMQAVQLGLDTFIIQFNSEEGKSYKLLISSDVSTPLDQWTVESVQVNGPEGWSGFMDEFQGTANSAQTQIRVPKNLDKAFFKVVLIQDAAE